MFRLPPSGDSAEATPDSTLAVLRALAGADHPRIHRNAVASRGDNGAPAPQCVVSREDCRSKFDSTSSWDGLAQSSSAAFRTNRAAEASGSSVFVLGARPLNVSSTESTCSRLLSGTHNSVVSTLSPSEISLSSFSLSSISLAAFEASGEIPFAMLLPEVGPAKRLLNLV